ncbi:MAG: type VI secretion system membrane subunit TssM [Pseudomonadota bacterium]
MQTPTTPGSNRLIGWLRPLFSHLKHSLRVLLVLSLIVLLVVLWVYGPELPYYDTYPLAPVTTRWLITLGIILLVVAGLAIAAWRKLAHIRAEAKRQQREQEDPVLPILRALYDRFDQTLTDLRQHIMRRDYLYALPWYMVIGSEGAGKTSLINRCGQKYTQSTYQQVKRRRGTKLPYKIDWWIGNDAIIIDPDGELISDQVPEGYGDYESLPQRVWQACIHWLERTRSRRPLNGILLVIDLPSILSMTSSDRKTYAGLLRSKLRDLSEQLSTRLPIYIILSKMDLLEGFEASFGHLSRAEREQSFGFTFSLSSLEDADRWQDEFNQGYTQLLDNLTEHTFEAIAKAPDQPTRQALFAFNRQFAGIRDTLHDFLADILESDRYATAALVRGLYYTSVYQQGIADNVYVEGAARNYDLPARIAPAQAMQRAQTYFSKNLFSRNIYPEAGLAGDNRRLLRRKRRLFVLASLIACIIGSATIYGWHQHYQHNKQAADIVLEKARDFTKTTIADADGTLDTTGRDLLEPLDLMYGALANYGRYREKIPLLADMGLYQGHIIGPKLEDTYLDLLRTRYLPALATGVAEQIQTAAPGSDDKLAALRVYRIMESQEKREPQNKDIVRQRLAETWHKHYTGQAGIQEALMNHLDYALDYVAADLPALRGVVITAQQDLSRIPISQRVYQGIVQRARTELPNRVDLRQTIGPAFDQIYQTRPDSDATTTDTNYDIPGFYTRQAFKGYFTQRNAAVIDLAAIDQWVLGERDTIVYSETDKTALTQKIRSHYVNDYLDTWKRALGQLQIDDFAGIAHGVKILETLTGPATPLQRLIETVRKHSEIYPDLKLDISQAKTPAEQALLKDPDRLAAKRILGQFHSLNALLEKDEQGQTRYETLLQTLRANYDYLVGVQNAPDVGKAALRLARDRFKLQGADPIYALQRTAEGLPEPLATQMQKVASESWRVLLIKALQQLEKKWDQDIYRFYRERLANRYPFNPNSTLDAALEDFETLFSPQGKLRTFYQKYLQVFLEDNLAALYNEETEDYLVDTSVLQQLDNAWNIQDGFFDPRGSLSIPFSLEPLALSGRQRRSLIDIEGQRIAYNHGPAQSSELIWPNSLQRGASSSISLINHRGRSQTLRYTGPWSLFRLLGRANLNGANDNRLDISFQIGNGSMRYRLYAEKSNSPLLRQLFRGFKLPRTLLRNTR